MDIEDRLLSDSCGDYDILDERSISKIRKQIEDGLRTTNGDTAPVDITAREEAVLLRGYIADRDYWNERARRDDNLSPIQPTAVVSLKISKTKGKAYAGRKVYVSPKSGKLVLNRRSAEYVPVGRLLANPVDRVATVQLYQPIVSCH